MVEEPTEKVMKLDIAVFVQKTPLESWTQEFTQREVTISHLLPIFTA